MDGITGIYAPGNKNLADYFFSITGDLQHRGKLSVAYAAGNKNGLFFDGGIGGVNDILNNRRKNNLFVSEPMTAIGNLGYLKDTENTNNKEPITIEPKKNSKYKLLITYDGCILNENKLKSELESDYNLKKTSTETLGALLHKCIEEEGISFEAGKKFMNKLHGRATFALTALVYDGKEPYFIAMKDDKSFENLCYLELKDNTLLVSSESCSLNNFGEAKELLGGEMILCSQSKGFEKNRLRTEKLLLPDIFQAVYFGHPSSMFYGKEIYEIRRKLGQKMAEFYKNLDADIIADIIIPIPESGRGVTRGIADYLRIPLEPDGLVKNSQAVRTFLLAQKRKRKDAVLFKFKGIPSILFGKNIIAGDDSIVKGSITEGGAVSEMLKAGAKSIEIWASYGGIIVPSFKEVYRGRISLDELAVQRALKDNDPYTNDVLKVNKAVTQMLGVRAVRYNTLKILKEVIGEGSYQTVDPETYPVAYEHLPDWLKKELQENYNN